MNPDETIMIQFSKSQLRLMRAYFNKGIPDRYQYILKGAVPCARSVITKSGDEFYRPSIGRVIIYFKDQPNKFTRMVDAISSAQEIIRQLELFAFPNVKSVENLQAGDKFRLKGQRGFKTFQRLVPLSDQADCVRIVYNDKMSMVVPKKTNVEIQVTN
jgi:hypothetical protein